MPTLRTFVSTLTAQRLRLGRLQRSASSQPDSTAKQPAVEHDPEDSKQKTKTQAQLDEEVRQKLAGLAGDGGEAGVEYEDGKPVAMKRSVQQNMFRYI